jgi:hypothetical protein
MTFVFEQIPAWQTFFCLVGVTLSVVFFYFVSYAVSLLRDYVGGKVEKPRGRASELQRITSPDLIAEGEESRSSI